MTESICVSLTIPSYLGSGSLFFFLPPRHLQMQQTTATRTTAPAIMAAVNRDTLRIDRGADSACDRPTVRARESVRVVSNPIHKHAHVRASLMQFGSAFWSASSMKTDGRDA